MVTIDEVVAFTEELPEVDEGRRYGMRTWFVQGAGFVWERPFSKADIKRFGDDVTPVGPIVAARVENLDEKDAVLAAGVEGVFTIPHFDGHPTVLIDLSRAGWATVQQGVIDAWLACAPDDLAAEHAEHLLAD